MTMQRSAGRTPGHSRRGTVMRRVLFVLALAAVLIGAGFLVRGYQKRSAAKAALALGLQAYEAERFGEAATELGRYLAAAPTDLDVLWKYADSLLRARPQTTNALSGAVSALERILRIDPKHPQAAGRLAEAYLAVQSPAEAERIAKRRLEVIPGEEAASRQLAAALIAQQKYDEAIAVLRPVVDGHPDRMEATATLALLLLRHRQDREGAQKLLEEMWRANPSSALAKLEMAKYLLASGDAAGADRLLAELETADIKEAGVLLQAAVVLLEMGLPDRAAAQFDRAEKAAPQDPVVYLARGRILLEAEAPEPGAALADRALGALRNENRFDVLPMAIEFYAATGRADDARRALDELRAAGAEARDLQYLSALVLLADGKTVEGVAALEDAVRGNAAHPRGNLVLAQVLAREGQRRRAVTYLERHFANAGRSNALVAQELAGLYGRMGDWGKAAEAAAKAEQLAPRSLSARLLRIETQAVAARQAGQADAAFYDRCIRQTRDLVAQVPKDPRPRRLAARLAVWAGQADAAIQEMQAAANELDTAAAFAALGDTCAEAGRLKEAVAAYEQALEKAGPEGIADLAARLAETLAANGDVTGAIERLNAALEKASERQRAASRLQFAQALLRNNQQAAARRLLVQAMAEDRTGLGSRLMFLELAPVEGERPTREEIVEQVRQIEGEGGVNWRYWRARLLLERPDWASQRARIEDWLKACLEKDPSWEKPVLAMGVVYEESNEIEAAFNLYRRHWSANPSNLDVASRLVAVAARLNRWADVDSVLQRLPADSPDFLAVRADRAARRGDGATAVRLLQERIQRVPDDTAAKIRLASLLLEAGDAAAAERLLDEAAASAPDSVDLLAGRVALLLRRNEPAKALALCDEAVARTPSPQARLLRARVHEAMKQPDLAEKDLRQAALSKDSAEGAWIELGRLRFRQGGPQEALAAWREGLTAMPGSLALRKEILATLAGSTDEAQRLEARRLLEQMAAEAPDDDLVLLLQAESLAAAKPAEAERLYQRVTQIQPTRVRAFQRLAQMVKDRGQDDKALDIVDQGLASNPRDVRLLLMKSQWLLPSSPHRAVIAAREACAAAPDSEEAAVAYANALAAAGNPRDAVEHLETFVARLGADKAMQARLTLARIRRSPADWEECFHALAAWRTSHPDDVRILGMGASLLMNSPEARHREAAIEVFVHITKQRPDWADGFGELGRAYYRLGRMEEANAAFTRGLQLAPDDPAMLNDAAWVLCEGLKNPQAAATVAGRAIEAGKETPNLLDTWGVIQYRLGDHGQSRAALEKAVRHPAASDSTKLSATFHLGRTLVHLDKAEARKHLESVLVDRQGGPTLSASDRKEAETLLKALADG